MAPENGSEENGYNAAGTKLGFAGIGPAVIVHEGSTLVVLFNSLRLMTYHTDRRILTPRNASGNDSGELARTMERHCWSTSSRVHSLYTGELQEGVTGVPPVVFWWIKRFV